MSRVVPRPIDDVRPLRIAHLYPSLLNVAGDGGNLRAIERRCSWRGIRTETVAISLNDVPDFEDFDLIMFHGGQDIEMRVVANDLQKKAAALREAADAGVTIFAVCAGLQLLGHRYIPAGEPVMEGAGVLDLETRGTSQRFMQHAACIVSFDDGSEEVVGFENHSGQTVLGPAVEPFGRVLAGAGNNGSDGTEGARRDNVFATYLHGPVLPKNPGLTDRLIRIALRRQIDGPVHLASLDDTVERTNHEVALEKALRNRGRRTILAAAQLGRIGMDRRSSPKPASVGR
jgi:lipid II isoglutaminyl synthase (glutamine-hydrolysing)